MCSLTVPTAWQQAVESARQTGDAAAETVISMLSQCSISERSQNCLALAAAQSLIKFSIVHYDMRDNMAIQTIYDENTNELIAEIVSLTYNTIVKSVDNDPEAINMAVLFASESLIQSVQLVDPIGGDVAQKVEELISDSVKSGLEQRCLMLAVAMQMLNVWIGSCGKRVGILAEPGLDGTSRNAMQIAAQALGTIKMGEDDKLKVNCAAISAATLLVMVVSPAHASA